MRCDTRVFYGASRITSFTEQLHHRLVFIYGLNGMFNPLQGNPLPFFLKLYWVNEIHGFLVRTVFCLTICRVISCKIFKISINSCWSCRGSVGYGAFRLTSFTEQLHHRLVFIYGLNGMFNPLQGYPLPIFSKIILVKRNTRILRPFCVLFNHLQGNPLQNF